jgi:hypothetical protein
MAGLVPAMTGSGDARDGTDPWIKFEAAMTVVRCLGRCGKAAMHGTIPDQVRGHDDADVKRMRAHWFSVS